MYPFPLGLYPDGYPRQILFTEMFYPTAIVPVPHNFSLYHRTLSNSEQSSPTDLSTNSQKVKSESSKFEEREQNKDSETKIGKKLNFGIDHILDKTTEGERTSKEKEKTKLSVDHSSVSSASDVDNSRLPRITSESLTAGVGEERIQTTAYPFTFSHLGAAGPFSFPPARYTPRSDYQSFQLLSPQDHRVSNHQTTPKRKRSWSRAVFSALQRKGLEKRFEIQKYVTKPDRRQLAAMLGLTDAQVKVWFQNRRMKWRHVEEQKKKRQQEDERRKRIISQNKTISQNAVPNDREITDTKLNVSYDELDSKEISDEIDIDVCMESMDQDQIL